jgi:hypothetical protein
MAGPMSDGELVRRCRTGDQAAWNELVERYSFSAEGAALVFTAAGSLLYIFQERELKAKKPRTLVAWVSWLATIKPRPVLTTPLANSDRSHIRPP